MERLISMTDFVLEQWYPENLEKEEFEDVYIKIHKYANFLKQPLTLGMFVPCDLDGNVLEPVIQMDYIQFEDRPTKYPTECYEYDLQKYQEAKERVLFEGFELARSVKAVIIVSNGIPIHFCSETKTIKHEKENYSIEDLFRRNDSLGYKLVLTESARKHLGL